MRNYGFLIAVGAFALLLLVAVLTPISWLSQILQGLATPIAAIAAILVYVQTKTDYKENIARSIIQEIRSAESEIRRLRQNAFIPNEINVLPSDSWKNNAPIFSRDLSTDQLDQMERFYSSCRFIDGMAKQMLVDIFEGYDAITKEIVVGAEDITAETFVEEMQKRQERAQVITQNSRKWAHLKDAFGKVELISETDAVRIMRKIAQL